VATPDGNLSGIEPDVRTDATPAEVEALLAPALEAHESGHYTEAAAALTGLGESHPDLRPLCDYYRAASERRAGRVDEARRLYRIAVETSPQINFGRARERQRAFLRALPGEMDVTIVDSAALMEAASPDRIPGPELYDDGHHPNLEGHALIGRAFARAVAARFGAELERPDLDGATLYALKKEPLTSWSKAEVTSAAWLMAASVHHPHPRDRLRWAERKLRSAIERTPDYFQARTGLAVLHLVEREHLLSREDGIAWLQENDLFYHWYPCVHLHNLEAIVARLRDGGVPEPEIEAMQRTAPNVESECSG
jgi:hypothetical protein